MIYKIARTELRTLFYSPVAWFLSIVFLIQCSVCYTDMLHPYARWQDNMVANNPKFKDLGLPLTQVVFLSPNSIFASVMQNLYLFVPLLTMGLISREVNNGSIKLLYSSPVKTRQIVLGKYLAVMLYNLLLVSIVGIFVMTAFFNIQSLDYGMLLSAELGFYLLMCAYTAIGLFMSSLTNYQIVSAIGSFLIIFILSRIGGLWQKYDFIRDLTYFLSLSGRTLNMQQGLISTKDVLYFLVIMSIFLSFTFFKLKDRQESNPLLLRIGRYVGVFLVALAIGYASSRPALIAYWDTTELQINTIHPNTQKIVKELGKEPLEVTLYTNLLGGGFRRSTPEARNTYLSVLWERYTRFKPDIDFNYEFYHQIQNGDSSLYKQFPGKTEEQIAERMADVYDTRYSLYKNAHEMHKRIDLEPENLRVVMQLKYKGRSTFLRTFEDPAFWPTESEVSAALKRLLQARMPKVYFLTGNLERNIHKGGEREFHGHSLEKLNRGALTNQGFDMDTLFLDRQNIPQDADIIVLGDPKTALSDSTISKLRHYIEGGGDMMILGEPGKQAMVNPVLRQLGVQLAQGSLVQPTYDEMPQIIKPSITGEGTNLSDEDMLLQLKEAMKEPDNEDSLKIKMDRATAVTIDTSRGFTVRPALVTAGKGVWMKQGAFVTDSAEIVYNPKEGDVQGSFPTMAMLTRKTGGKEQRIIVSGDADFMSNSRVTVTAFLVKALYSWLDHNNFPIYAPNPKLKDGKLLISNAGVNVMAIIYVWVLPALVLIFGTVLLIRRKRK